MKNPFSKKKPPSIPPKEGGAKQPDLAILNQDYFAWLQNPPKFHCENHREKNPSHPGFKLCTEQCAKCHNEK